MKALAAVAVVLAVLAAPALARAGTVGTSFPAGFPVITDASLGVPVIGFGAAGPVRHTPVIFLHGNNDTPFPTACNPFYGAMQAFAQSFLDHGYSASELWGLGYQGDQCDLGATPTNRSGEAHSTAANVPDLDRFVRAVLAYTGATRVDIVGHSLGGTLVRAWIDEEHANHLVRRVVTIASPNHGITDCSPDPANYWQLAALGGFTPDSAICREYGSDETPLLERVNRGNETRGSVSYLSIFNADTDFVYISSAPDGLLAPVPAQDRDGRPHDFSLSPRLDHAVNVPLTGQGEFDPLLGTAHLGIANSPVSRTLAFEFLAR